MKQTMFRTACAAVLAAPLLTAGAAVATATPAASATTPAASAAPSAAPAAPAAPAAQASAAAPAGQAAINVRVPGADLSTSPAAVALRAMVRELGRPEDRKLPATVRMERLAAQQLTPDTAAKLRAAFGTDRLYTLARQPGPPGRVDWRLTVPALHYAPSDGAAFDWSEGRFDFQYNPAGTTALTHGAWGTLSATGSTMRLAVRDVTLDSNQKSNRDGLWFGTTRVDVAGVDVQSKDGAAMLEMSGLHTELSVTDKRKTADLAYDSRIDRIAVAGEHVDDLHFAWRLTNIDQAALVALGDAGATRPDGFDKLTPAQQAEAMKPLLRSFGKAALGAGTALAIDDISASYHGHKVTLKGNVALQGAVEADLDDIKTLARKVVAHVEIRVPIALVREIAGTVAAKQAAQQGQATDPDSIARLRQSITDVIVGKLVGGGYARVEDEVLVSTIDWRDGQLRANGKPFALPTPQPQPQPQPQGQAAIAPGPRQQDMLQARRIDDSCTLPDYPDDVVRQDQPLSMTARVLVGADGKVKNAALVRPSKFPDYDRAVVAALMQCQYIPALRGGQPVAAAMPWQLERAPGSKHP